MTTNRNNLIFLLVLVIYVLGCGLFSNSGDAEMVFAATEVGAPEGEKVTKDIGPEGGTLSSPDGRLTLTVPPDALTERLPFSIQPITNKAMNGLGLAYRLEPDGKTFAMPLEIGFRYDENDLEGTLPEAFSIAYQNNKGNWHASKSAKLDQDSKTLTVLTSHFSDFAFIARYRMEPTSLKLFVGESAIIGLTDCTMQGSADKPGAKPGNCSGSPIGQVKWEMRGEGLLEPFPGIPSIAKYTAPNKKPKPNVASARISAHVEVWNADSGQITKSPVQFATQITIVDRGYRADGKTGDTTYSGVICDLEAPFTVTGNNPFITYPLKFEPTSATSGKMNVITSVPYLNVFGEGTYTIVGADTDKPRIALTAGVTGQTPKFSQTGAGTVYIDLIPLETKECG